MKQKGFLIVCAFLMVACLGLTACGDNGSNSGTDAPYEDETQRKVNDGASNELKDAGDNLMDSIRDTGDAIKDGVDNLGNGTRNETNP